MIAVAVAYRRDFEGFPLPHNCRACEGRQGRAKRKEWGCDRKSTGKNPQLTIPCSYCLGAPGGCRECKGSGKKEVWRCPIALLDPGAVEARLLHHAYPQALPCAGGLRDQPASYIQTMRILEIAEGRMQALIHEEAQQTERRVDGRH